MAEDPKKLQQLAETEAVTLEWSTISNIHTKQMLEGADAEEQVKLLQTLNAAPSPVPLDWSTISNVHTKM